MLPWQPHRSSGIRRIQSFNNARTKENALVEEASEKEIHSLNQDTATIRRGEGGLSCSANRMGYHEKSVCWMTGC